MADGFPSLPHVRADGKFFRAGDEKFHIKGVAYGPFAPHDGPEGPHFASPERTAADFALIRELGANLLRVYHVPPRWLLDLAAQHGLRLLIDIPWAKNRCFLDSWNAMQEARIAVRDAVRTGAAHPAVFAFSVVNEIPPDIVRWSGAREMTAFIEELIEVAKSVDPNCLYTFANYPPTEFLHPRNVDFLAFNVYLHHRRPFENYLARLQMQADTIPLVLAEFGVDSKREGEPAKCEMLAWQIEAGFRAGLAGMVLFSFTDDWYVNGHVVRDWSMGLTTTDRVPKESFRTVQSAFAVAPYFPRTHAPKVSVIVATYNGARTLKACLDSLVRLNYPDYEVIVVDDGSTDTTPQICSNYTSPADVLPALRGPVRLRNSIAAEPAPVRTIRYIRQDNHGLSVARNTGIAAAQGEIIAFTDSDCRADEDWLHYLVGDLITSRFTGIGGHNFLPPEDSPVAAAVLVSPGGPAHVMINDRVAEHIPGCNMAFYKWALDEIGGFDTIYRQAGDDVDVCWRLQQRGYRIGFNPAGFVWHFRRSTVGAYLKQQRGYGEAEALLVRKHPEYFNSLGGGVWRGRIYTPGKFGLILGRSVIYHGVFGTGFFQTLYAANPSWALMLLTSFEFHVLITLPLLVLSAPFHFLLPIAVTSLLLSLAICVAAASQAELPKNKKRWWSHPLIALLFFLQPLVRGWARYQGRFGLRMSPEATEERLKALKYKDTGEPLDCLYYWGEMSIDRIDWVTSLVLRLDQQGWPSKTDSGWSEHDIEIFGSRWSQLQLTTATEDYGPGKRLFRCRLRSCWSLPGHVAFWLCLAAQLLLIGVIARDQPLLWMLLLSMPLLAWFLEQERRDQQQLIAMLLDDVARQRGMTKLKYDRSQDKLSVDPNNK